MSLFYNNLLLGASGQGGGGPFYDYQIEQSIRIGSGDTLRRTPGKY